MKRILFQILIIPVFFFSCLQEKNQPLMQSENFTVFRDSVIQGQFSAKAISATEMKSNYFSLEASKVSSKIAFKFSINSRDNEMPSGIDHHIVLDVEQGNDFTSVVKFGEQMLDTVGKIPKDLPKNAIWQIKLDMRQVFEAFDKQGFYKLFNGEKLYKNDFKAVYIAGSTEPLSWDFENLYHRNDLKLSDNDGDHIFEITLKLNPQKEKELLSVWKLESDISHLPQFNSDILLSDALYNLSLDELIKNMAKDGTYNTGKEWQGVWTRDVSYSTVLSLALVQPEIAKNSLLRKVKNNRIIQDTGTGGAWPVSTDRTTWALAAWELYKFTGDKNWLAQAYEIIVNSLEDDLKVAHDAQTHLVCGESSFLDWREQTYPKWMQPIDIFNSKCLGTNVVHFQSFVIVSEMGKLLGKETKKFSDIAKKLKTAINEKFWMEEKGYYGQFFYGKNYEILSPRTEALGEALSVLYNVADAEKQMKIIENTPVTEFGIPCIFPQIPNIQPYHNNGIWAFVESFWALASAKVGNEESLIHSIGGIYRQAALFLTNKENMVAEGGDYAGTAINSDRQLWSVAGNLALVYRIFMGMDFQPEGIEFKPFVPKSFAGKKSLTNFAYRQMNLEITVEGYGNTIESFRIDGKKHEKAFLNANLKGKHKIEIKLTNKSPKKGKINLQKVDFSNQNSTSDNFYTHESFKIYKNGKLSNREEFEKMKTDENLAVLSEFMFVGISPKGYESFSGEPFHFVPKKVSIFECEDFAQKSNVESKGFSGKGFVEISLKSNTVFDFEIEVAEAGTYAIDFKYANGTGPINTDNNCAIRTLWLENKFVGSIVMPQRGTDEWSNWGFSNSRQVRLNAGKNNLKLTFEPYNQNMDGEINNALIDYARVLKIN